MKRDLELFAAIDGELNRQRNKLELIASENIVSRAVLEAQGSVLTNFIHSPVCFDRMRE